MVAPDFVAMLAMTMESVRSPVRSSPASEPMRSMLTRGVLAHGSGFSDSGVDVEVEVAVPPPTGPLPAKTVPTRSRWMTT